MNEDLLDELSAAMKRRDKALAARARWQEQLEDAENDIQLLSARITESVAGEDDDEDDDDEAALQEVVDGSGVAIEPATWAWTSGQEPVQVQE